MRPRSLELLVLLLSRPAGWKGAALAMALYGEVGYQALKVEIHRLRALGLAIGARPYRLLTPLQADFVELREALEQRRIQTALALYRGPLLPKSQAPGIEALRRETEEALRAQVLESRRPELLYTLSQKLADDLEVWEACLAALLPQDPRYPASLAWVRRLRAMYRFQ